MTEPLANVAPVTAEEIAADPMLAVLFLVKRRTEATLAWGEKSPWWTHPISCPCEDCRDGHLEEDA